MTTFHAAPHGDDRFTFAQLVAVDPLAQTQPLGPLTLTLISIERYQSGYVAQLIFEQVTASDADPAAALAAQDASLLFGALPAIAAHDDLDQQYVGRPLAGYGGGMPGGEHHRNVYAFTPALANNAHTLALDVHLVTRLSIDADGRPLWTEQDIVGGPWQATFTLHAHTP